MEINTTFIVAVTGILAALIIGIKSKFSGYLSGILTGRKTEHENKNKIILHNIEQEKQRLIKKEEQIKVMEEKIKTAKKNIKEITKSGNTEIKKISEEKDMKSLLDEFEKW